MKSKIKEKNIWKTFSILFLVVIVLILAINIFLPKYNDIKLLTGITKPSTLYSISRAIDNSPLHSINLCDKLNHCFVVGRLS